MTSDDSGVAALVRHFEIIARRHMRGLPIVNPKLSVEAAGARQLGEHRVCVLISPWFMNLVLLPGSDAWAGVDQGHVCDVTLPGDTIAFTVCHDDVIGTFLTAVMFRTVSDFPDQETARRVAMEILTRLFAERVHGTPAAATGRGPVFSRRALLTGSVTGDA